MKICVIGGGGAIGGYLAVMLARAGNDVTVVARGATLKAIQERGLALITNEEPEPLHATVTAVEKIADAGKPDIVILAEGPSSGAGRPRYGIHHGSRYDLDSNAKRNSVVVLSKAAW